MKILVCNAGSSSQKYRLFEMPEAASTLPPPPLWQDDVEGEEDLTQARERFISLWQGAHAVLSGPEEVAAIGYRLVHGGRHYTQRTELSEEVIQHLESLQALAPLHDTEALRIIRMMREIFPGIPQIAVFDTAFHTTLPLSAKVYPGPFQWYEQGYQRFGFHGISHAYCARRSAELLRRDLNELRVISCHLGGGCSVAAISQGKSRDTTMGFTPLEGIMMGTRSGSLDPGLLLFLLQSARYTVDELSKVLYRESGLKGISGISGDMRELLYARKEGNVQAELAFDLFVQRLSQAIGAMAVSLGGLDVLSFTGGIGTFVPEVRQQTCTRLAFLGVTLDNSRNEQCSGDGVISTDASALATVAIHAQEEWEIAQECQHFLTTSGERTHV